MISLTTPRGPIYNGSCGACTSSVRCRSRSPWWNISITTSSPCMTPPASIKGKHVQGYKVQIEDVCLSLGVSQVADGCATTSFSSFLRRIKQILSSLGRGGDLEALLRETLEKMVTSLSDKCPTEVKWAHLLEDKKFELIEREYVQMSKEEQKAKAKVFISFCCAHALSGVTEIIEAMFKEDRDGVFSAYKDTAFNAIREVSKAFHPHSEWGFQLFPHYMDWCKDNEYSMHSCLKKDSAVAPNSLAARPPVIHLSTHA